MTNSYLISLKCSRCNELHDAHKIQTVCKKCKSHLLAQYDLGKAKKELDRDKIILNRRRMWKWGALLPVFESRNIVSLGEGESPMLKASQLQTTLGMSHLFIKDESGNPTGTFKARGLASAISKAVEFGISKVVIPTAGNAGAAMAAYAARAGLEALVVMPKDTPKTNIEEVKAYGGEIILVDGLISDAGKLASEMTESDGWFNVATFKEPYRVEGKKIMGYEIAEAFAWELPEVIVYPTGGGTGLIGMWIAFQELKALGWLSKLAMPCMVAVQSSGCAPVVQAFELGFDEMKEWKNAETIASGLRVPNSLAGHQILSTLYTSKGIAIDVSDKDILSAQKEMGEKEGIFPAPEGAATLAGLRKLIESSRIQPDERVVLLNTGAGMKYIS